MLKVYEKCCNNCLLSKDRIVSPSAAKQIIKECKEKQTHFICHKATMAGGEEILCKNFYDKFGEHSQLVRIAERLGMIKMVPQPDAEKLIPYREINKSRKNSK